MSDIRIVIYVHGVECLADPVTWLAAADARRVRGSRSFAIDGPTITPIQAEAIGYFISSEDTTVTPPEIPEWWTISGDPYQEPAWMEEEEAAAWWVESYNNPAPKL